MSPERGRCPVCNRSVVLRNHDGRLRRHGFSIGRGDTECKGSGGPPSPEPQSVVERQHPRRSS